MRTMGGLSPADAGEDRVPGGNTTRVTGRAREIDRARVARGAREIDSARVARSARLTGGARPWPAVIALALAVGVAGCGTEPADEGTTDGVAAAAADEAGVRVVSPAQASQLMAASPQPTIIDVRTPGEYAAGHIDGAELVDYNSAAFRDEIATYPRDGSYVIYCRSGNRSAGARQVMTELGFEDVADIDGGIVAWSQAGLPVTG